MPAVYEHFEMKARRFVVFRLALSGLGMAKANRNQGLPVSHGGDHVELRLQQPSNIVEHAVMIISNENSYSAHDSHFILCKMMTAGSQITPCFYLSAQARSIGENTGLPGGVY